MARHYTGHVSPPLLHGPVHNHFHHHGITSTITNMNIIVKISLRWHAIKDIFSALAPLMLIVLKIFFRLSKPYLFLSGSADLKEETYEEICLNKRKPRRGDKSDIWGNWDIAKTWREQFSEKSGEARKLRGVRKSWKEIWDLGIWRNPPRRQMGLWNQMGRPRQRCHQIMHNLPPRYHHIIISFHFIIMRIFFITIIIIVIMIMIIIIMVQVRCPARVRPWSSRSLNSSTFLLAPR